MRSRILLLLTLLAVLLLSNTATAQWLQTSGPSGGQVSSFVKTDNGWLAMIGQGLYKFENGRWTKQYDQWYGQLFQSGNTIISAHVSQAKVSTNGGSSWSDISLPSAAILTIGGNFYAQSGDTIFKSTDGMNWTLHARTPMESFGIVEHRGNLYTTAGFNGLMISKNLGETWQPLPEQPFSFAMEWYSTPNALYAIPYGGGLYRTTDEGVTWEPMNRNLYEGTVFEAVVGNGTDLFASDWNTTYQLKNDQWVEAPVAYIHSGLTIDGKIYMATNSGLMEYSNGKFTPMDEGIYVQNVSALGRVGNSLFARTNAGVYRTQDMGTTWEFNSTNHALDIASAQGSIVIRGTSILRSTDEGTTWINIDDVLADFVVAPTDLIAYNNDLYLASGLVSAGEHGSGQHWTTGGIYRSTDGGASWRDMSGNLPANLWTSVPVYTVAAANGKLVLNTADGLFVGSEGSTNWQRIGKPQVSYAIEIYSTGSQFYMIADSIWYVSSDGEQWTQLNATAPADFMSNWESVYSFSAVRGIPYVTLSRYERIDSTSWRSLFRNFKLENNAWIDITATLPAGTVTSPLIEHNDVLFAGTSSAGVWKMALPTSDVAITADPARMQTFPNPTVDRIRVTNELADFRIYNALGQDITSLTRKLDDHTLDVRSLNAGAYQLVVDGVAVGFVKQ
ncbi:MAG TPA: T9SS type A sorting domain-containing protein [Candidatus Kapabacteria bacterium]|nr:T9SS type A sorting domain-containing protein [Candidatus Kapabacteria bacterium]